MNSEDIFKETKGSKGSGRQLSARNLYREHWSLPISTAEISSSEKGFTIHPEVLRVTQKFNGGMVYEVKGQKFILSENIFGDYPFLIVFSLDAQKELNFLETKFMGIPDAVIKEVRMACEQISRTIKLPENLHNIEVEITKHLARNLPLPEGWKIVKGIMKVQSRRPGGDLLCDCDVDGPCGYCCDTCDCNCYNCC